MREKKRVCMRARVKEREREGEGENGRDGRGGEGRGDRMFDFVHFFFVQIAWRAFRALQTSKAGPEAPKSAAKT